MKILIIYGGTRLGNTWKATALVKEELQAHSKDIEFDEIQLKNLDLPYCLGCSQCFRKGHTNCPHNAVIQMILDKMEASDGIIISAPTYNMQMPALTKNLIDHLCYLLHRPRFFEKKGLIISTTGGVGAKEATKYMAAAMLGWGFNRCYQLPIVSISWNDYKPSEKDKRKTAAVVRKFYTDLASHKLHSPVFSSVLVFNLMRGLSTAYRKGSEFENHDGDFWEQEGYVGETYSPKIPTPIYKKLFGMIFFQLAKSISKKTIVTYKK